MNYYRGEEFEDTLEIGRLTRMIVLPYKEKDEILNKVCENRGEEKGITEDSVAEVYLATLLQNGW